MKLIDKSALLAEIERNLHICAIMFSQHQNENCVELYKQKAEVYQGMRSFIDTLEVREVDLENEISKYIAYNICPPSDKVKKIAKHFFELGLNASNPVSEVNLESLVRQVIDLNLEAGEHYNNIIKEERKEYGGSDLAINLLCGTMDAKELGIQYVLDKLKAQKGEEV